MNVEEQEKRLLDYKQHERRYSKDTCQILSTQGTEEPNKMMAEIEAVVIWSVRESEKVTKRLEADGLMVGMDTNQEAYKSINDEAKRQIDVIIAKYKR